MFGSTSSGPAPKCEIDVMGHNRPPAVQKKIVGVTFQEHRQSV
jgi:hypothetical protein